MMFEKEAEETVDKSNWLFPQSKELAKDFWQKGAEFGYNKGLEAGRPKWHDLRKDPNDLPKEVGHYIVCYLDTTCERHTFELSFVDWFEDKHWIDEDNHNIEGYDEGVIAWCEEPIFKEY